MTRPRRPTNRAFTIAVCTSCASESVISALARFRSLIRRCPHGMLVQTSCLLGGLTCASRPTGGGVMVILQPCSPDRTPAGPALWFGPLESVSDVKRMCDFVERGRWEPDDVARLPNQLLAHNNWVTSLSSTN